MSFLRKELHGRLLVHTDVSPLRMHSPIFYKCSMHELCRAPMILEKISREFNDVLPYDWGHFSVDGFD